jgi:hypothetical protein
MEPEDKMPFDLDDVPEWVKKGTNVIAFILVCVLALIVALFLFFFVVKAGLWAVGVL